MPIRQNTTPANARMRGGPPNNTLDFFCAGADSSTANLITRNSSAYPLKSIVPNSKDQPDTFFLRWRQVIISAGVFLVLLIGTISIIVGIFEYKRRIHPSTADVIAAATNTPAYLNSKYAHPTPPPRMVMSAAT
ncbi:hypothetical protein TWF694_003480 [Orbilia ellipsospora]|uniref:Uncharacterized protein n=1 Tax=Orbilia ellipsospora TaxID=2528407 RepID=A0AAV9WYC0_9PEZI